MRKVIAVDFDGTLFENAWPGIGAPRVNVIAAALREQQNGAALILWTCRIGEALRAALEACEAQGLHFDAVNDSLPEWKDSFDGDPRKIGATEYWDDRAVNPDRTPGFPTGEPLTLEQLRHMDEQPVLYDGTCFIVRLNYPIYGDAIVYCDDLLILLDEAVEHGVYAYYPPSCIDQETWVRVEDRLPETEEEVRLFCVTPSGYEYQCQGFYVPPGKYRDDSGYSWDWECCEEYDEERDDYLVNPGWYESIHNWDEYSACGISDRVTHWMPLPKPPKED